MAATISILSFASMAWAVPAIFKDMQLSAAKTSAKQDGKILLIDFTASWCGPCHRMDDTTWNDPEVKKWVDENAIAIQIDVDKEKDTASALKIMAMPSLVIFTPKDESKEFDRQIGYQSGPELLKWLNAVKRGETSIDMLKRDLQPLFGKGGTAEVDARHKLGATLLRAGNADEASEHFLWLWQNMEKQDAKLASVRSSVFPRELQEVVKQSPLAKQKLTELRDKAEADNPLDFMVLNEVLGQNDKTLAWFDKAKKDSSQLATLQKYNYRLEPLLINSGRWKDAAILYPNVLAELDKRAQFAKAIRETMHPRHDPFAQGAGRLYAIMLAAGRNSDAKKVSTAAIKMSDTPELKRELVLYAIDAGQARKDMVELVKSDEDASAQLEEALKKKSAASSKSGSKSGNKK